MDEFALSWNNFSSNISSGFQDLFDKGFLVDCTLAVEGKLIHVHKIVLAICSPYFQEMFTTNSCKHPIVVMSPEVSHSLMKELIQFMYKGEVNVKQTELTKFMKIAESLKIKGLTTFNNLSPSKTPDDKIQSEISQNESEKRPQLSAPSQKRERSDDINQKQSKQLKRNNNEDATESLDSMTEEIYVPQNHSLDSRFDSVTIKREDSVELLDEMVEREQAPSNIRISSFVSGPQAQTFSTFEYPNELQPLPNDYNKAGHSSDSELLTTVKLMNRKLDHIMKALTTERVENMDDMDPFFDPPEMLFKSIDDLYAFDQSLKNDSTFNDNMLRWFLARATKGGAQKEVTGKTKFVLNTLMHKELYNVVCWSGKKNEKHELRSCSSILSLILTLCQRKGKESKSVTADDVKHAIKEYFKRIGEENKKLLATGKSIDELK